MYVYMYVYMYDLLCITITTDTVVLLECMHSFIHIYIHIDA